MMTVTPAYGRDYKSQKAVKADWNAGKDFVLRDISSQWDGRLCNKEDLAGKSVMVRYHNLTRIVKVQ